MASHFRRRPRGLLRLVLRLPIWLYRLRLGWLLGHRFLLLTHRGRKTGRVRRTVLEVVHYDPATRESIVAAAWQNRADWYRNIQARPALRVQTAGVRYTPAQQFLTPDERYAMLRGYERAHPLAAWIGARLLGIPFGRSEAALRAFAASLPMVAFRPRRAPERGV
ncbi:MAG TPA: nitroreductase family deazaflavin-dependent oxidoreductase [Chloroflexota bacterium]|nr:nitroreductase family deazaflavin-dependent oxidoreductase [Chloroflexota bacterium]